MKRVWFVLMILTMFVSTTKISLASDWPVIGSTFYYWWDKGKDPDPNYFFYKPMEYSYTTGKLVNFGPDYDEWWERGMSGLDASGTNVVFPVLWAEFLDKNVLRSERSIYPYIPKMVETINKNAFDLKVGFFTASEHLVFNSETEWHNFYIINELVPFFETVPKSMIATHNGETINNGGRPILMFWGPSLPPGMSGDRMVQIYRQKVEELVGIDPFIVIEVNDIDLFRNSLDGLWDWNRTIGPATNHEKNGYKITAAGVGNNEALIRPWRCDGEHGINNFKPRNEKNDGSLDPSGAREAAKIVDDFRITPSDTDFLFIQDSNEMAEGSGWLQMQNYPQMDNPLINWCAPDYILHDPVYGTLESVRESYERDDNGKYLDPDYYMSKIRQEIEKKWGKREYDMQVLEQNIPMEISSNGDYHLKIRNRGSKTWIRDKFRLGYRLYEKGKSEVAMDLVKNGRLVTLSKNVASGESVDVNFAFNESDFDGLDEEYVLKIDMVEEGVTWFEWKRDGALRRIISLP